MHDSRLDRLKAPSTAGASRRSGATAASRARASAWASSTPDPGLEVGLGSKAFEIEDWNYKPDV